MKPPSVVHSESVVLPLDTDAVYIGVGSFGPAGCSVRTTQWMNAFDLEGLDKREAVLAYTAWLDARMDIEEFIRPLLGKSLVCDCRCEETCHGWILQKKVQGVRRMAHG